MESNLLTGKKAGWFSRRHQTNGPHLAAIIGKEAALANQRVFHRAFEAKRQMRSPSEQVAHLDAILGVGMGAVRERKRLASLIEKAKADAIKVDDVAKADAAVKSRAHDGVMTARAKGRKRS